jgi:hypothetical protein
MKLEKGMVLEVVSEDFDWDLLTPGDRGEIIKAVDDGADGIVGPAAYFRCALPTEGVMAIINPVKKEWFDSGKIRPLLSADHEKDYVQYSADRQEWFTELTVTLGGHTTDPDEIDEKILDFVGLLPGMIAKKMVLHGFASFASKIEVWESIKRLEKVGKLLAMGPPGKPSVFLPGVHAMAECRLYRT